MKKWMLLTRLPMVFVLSLVLPEETTPAESPTIEKAALTRLFTNTDQRYLYIFDFPAAADGQGRTA